MSVMKTVREHILSGGCGCTTVVCNDKLTMELGGESVGR